MGALEQVKEILRGEAEAEAAENAAKRDGDGDPQYARLICREHGPSFITEAEYEEQLACPDARWECTVFCHDAGEPIGPCGAPCDFDDEYFEAKHLGGEEDSASQ